MLVICNGMLRSGSTLQYNMVRLLVEALGRGTGEGYFPEVTPRKISQQMANWGRSETLHVVKTHDLYSDAEALVEKGFAKICYIHRDIRDVAASARNKFNHEWDLLLSILDASVETYYRLKKMDRVLWQRYETVVGDVSSSTLDLAHFLDVSPSKAVVSAIVSECSIDSVESKAKSYGNNAAYRMKKNLRRLRFIKPVLVKAGVPDRVLAGISRFMLTHDGKTLLHADHISSTRGDSGIWRSVFTTREQEILTDRYREWLGCAGYC